MTIPKRLGLCQSRMHRVLSGTRVEASRPSVVPEGATLNSGTLDQRASWRPLDFALRRSARGDKGRAVASISDMLVVARWVAAKVGGWGGSLDCAPTRSARDDRGVMW